MKKITAFVGSFILILSILASFSLTPYALKRQILLYSSCFVADRRDGVTPLAELEHQFFYSRTDSSLRWMYFVTPVIDTERGVEKEDRAVVRGSCLQRRAICSIETEVYRLSRPIYEYLELYNAFDLGCIGADRFIVSLADAAVDKERVTTFRATCARSRNSGVSDELYPEKDRSYLFVITLRCTFKKNFDNLSRFVVVFGFDADGEPCFVG